MCDIFDTSCRGVLVPTKWTFYVGARVGSCQRACSPCRDKIARKLQWPTGNLLRPTSRSRVALAGAGLYLLACTYFMLMHLLTDVSTVECNPGTDLFAES